MLACDIGVALRRGLVDDISVPANVGKPMARLEKVKVNNAGCYLKKPIYETVKFIHDPRTGKINERLSLYDRSCKKYFIPGFLGLCVTSKSGMFEIQLMAS